MRTSALIFIAAAVAITVFIIGALLILGMGTTSPVTMPLPPLAPANSSVPGAPKTTPEAPAGPATTIPNTPVTPLTPEEAQAELQEVFPIMEDWDAQVQSVIDAGETDLEVATKLLELMPRMPETNRVEAAELMTALMPDENYAILAPILTNAAMSEVVLDVLMVDLLDRPAAIQMPLFLHIARDTTHPRREEALDYMTLFLQEDHEEDWAAWEKSIQQYIAETPEGE